jgi:hypothetical protein
VNLFSADFVGKQVESEWPGEIGRVPSNYPINATTLLEVALLQSDEKGGWLLNGYNLLSFQYLSASCRLNSITNSEVLRVLKREIRAVAWVQVISTGSITLQLDTVLSDWKKTQQVGNANAPFAMPDSFHLNLFAGWSKPIWLTEFHRVGEASSWLAGISTVLKAAESVSKPPSDSLAEMLKKRINPWLAGLENVSTQPANATVEAVKPQKNRR